MKRRKASRSVAYQIKWRIGNRELLRQVRGDIQRERLELVLASLDHVDKSSIQVMQLRR
jgi:hypothetical protein